MKLIRLLLGWFLSLSTLAELFIKFEETYGKGQPLSQKARIARLRNKIRDLDDKTPLEVLADLGITRGMHITRKNSKRIDTYFTEGIDNSSQCTSRLGIIRRFFKWLMEEGYIRHDEVILMQLKQVIQFNGKKNYPTSDELGKIEQYLLSSNTFSSFQLFFIIILELKLCLRSHEVLRMNISDIDLEKRTVRVYRKSKREQFFNIPKDLLPVFAKYLNLRKSHLDQNKAGNVDALIVKISDKIIGAGKHTKKKYDWRLSLNGLLARWRNLKKKAGIRASLNLHDIRRLSTSEKAVIAKVFKLDADDISDHTDHSRGIMKRHYDIHANDYMEFMTRDLNGNLELVEEYCRNALVYIEENPNDLAYIAGFKKWMDTLGELQIIKDIRDKMGKSVSFGFSETLKSINDEFQAKHLIGKDSKDEVSNFPTPLLEFNKREEKEDDDDAVMLQTA